MKKNITLAFLLLFSIFLNAQSHVEEKMNFTIPFSTTQEESDFMKMGGETFLPLPEGSYTMIQTLNGEGLRRNELNTRDENDGQPLEIDCSAIFDQPLECRSDLPPVDFDLPIVVHSQGPVVKSALTIIPGNSGCPGDPLVINRTYFNQDTSSSTPSQDCMQTFTVESTMGPTLTLPADITIGCYLDSVDPAATGMATATASCTSFAPNPGITNITFSDVSTQEASGIGLYVYTITRTWTATDGCGRSVSMDQIIEVDSTIACASEIPTMGQWGIFILGLLMSILGIVMVRVYNTRLSI